MTPNKEDYLKIILELGGDEHKVANKQVGAAIGVAAASVTEMVDKLEEARLVTHTPYHGIQLTDSGRLAAAKLVRNHRLWEVFLMTQLLYPYDALHSEAELLEHATTDDMANRLDYFLKRPKTCPHGGAIPDANGNYVHQSTTPLADLQPGAKATVERVMDESNLLDFLSVIDIKLNDEVLAVDNSNGGITLRVSRTGKVVMVKSEFAQGIFITSPEIIAANK